jgi:hypothetical protein
LNGSIARCDLVDVADANGARCQNHSECIKTSGRWSRFLIALGLLAGIFCGAPASAETPAAQSNKANELVRAGKYFEALPLAKAAVASLEKTSLARGLLTTPSCISPLMGWWPARSRALPSRRSG